MAQPSPFVSVIVPTYRRFEPLLETAEDLLAQDYAPFEVIVADQNGSWPAEWHERLATVRADPRVKWLALGRVGVVAARNHAVEVSQGDVLLFVDDDVFIPSRRLLANHVRRFENDAVVAVVGRERQVGESIAEPAEATDAPDRPLPPPERQSPLQQTLWFNRNGDRAQEVCTFCTCNSSIRRRAFLSVGGFDEGFAGNSYGDDYDLALRLRRPDRVIVYDPAAWLIHRRAPIGGLRMTDRGNVVDGVATVQGFWLFVLRHGHRGMYGHLVLHHVLRKTMLLKRNIVRPWRQPAALWQTAAGLWRAWRLVAQGPRSRFMTGVAKSEMA